MLVQPQRQGIAHRTGHKGRGRAGGQTLLGLPRELRFAHLQGQQVRAAIHHVFGGEFDAARQEVAEVAKFSKCFEHALTQAADLRAALTRWHQIHVALGQRFALVEAPLQRPLHRLFLTASTPDNSLGGHQFRTRHLGG